MAWLRSATCTKHGQDRRSLHFVHATRFIPGPERFAPLPRRDQCGACVVTITDLVRSLGREKLLWKGPGTISIRLSHCCYYCYH